MMTAQFFNLSRIALASVAFGLLAPAVNAQPAAGMPGDMKKPMPAMDMKHGTNMKHGTDMKSMILGKSAPAPSGHGWRFLGGP